MIKTFIGLMLLAIALPTAEASAEPIKLKLSLVTSDRSLVYRGTIKRFVDAVNVEARGLLEIEVYFSGALGKDPRQQPQIVDDGVADLAFIYPGYSPERFYDNTVIELPGLFRDSREASFVFTRLIAAGALKGYEEFFVVVAIASAPENIHSRQPIASIADLKGMSIRINNHTEAAAVERLGMRPVQMQVNRISEAISDGTIDGAAVPPVMLFEVGVGRVTSYHYMLDVSSAPLALVMNRKKFESLPEQAQDIIRKHGGEWLLKHVLQYNEAGNREVMEQLTSNPRRKVIYPSQEDLVTARAEFKSVVDEWAAKSPDNRKQLEIVKAEIAKLRADR
jgi:TRAP-type C4-dicarboxylate transport system substrate-binding protein